MRRSVDSEVRATQVRSSHQDFLQFNLINIIMPDGCPTQFAARLADV